MANDKWESCPECGSKKVQQKSIGHFMFVGLTILGLGFLFIVIMPIGILLILLGIYLLLISPSEDDKLFCENCNSIWKYPFEQTNKTNNIYNLKVILPIGMICILLVISLLFIKPYKHNKISYEDYKNMQEYSFEIPKTTYTIYEVNKYNILPENYVCSK
jgi:uncharacterized membrane protein